MRRNAHIQRALLAVLDATDEYRSTYELTLAAYDYPPNTDLRGISPTHIAGARYGVAEPEAPGACHGRQVIQADRSAPSVSSVSNPAARPD